MRSTAILSFALLALTAPAFTAPVEQRDVAVIARVVSSAADDAAADSTAADSTATESSSSTASAAGGSSDSIASTIGKGLLGGLGSGLGSNIITEAVDGIKSLFNRTIEVRAPALHARQFEFVPLIADVGESLLGGAAASVGSNLLGDAVGDVESLFNRSIETREPAHESRQLAGLAADIGESLLGGAAAGVGSSLLGDAINEVEGLFNRSVESRELQELD